MPVPLAAFLLLAAPTTVPIVGSAKPCKPLGVTMARSRQAIRAKPLGDMPPATQALAVYRERNGCAELAVVRETVGTPARR